jgi:hypothetical protein
MRVFRSVDNEETRDESAGGISGHEEPSPEEAAECGSCCDEAGSLFSELMQAPARKQLQLLRKPRFRSPALLEFLLEASHASQPSDPPRAHDLAHLAVRLSRLLAGGNLAHFAARLAGPLARLEAAAALPRACCLAANARRLGDDAEGADDHLAEAAPFVELPSERVFYSRIAALVRWEQGRPDEAAALLMYAARLSRQEGYVREEGACQGLLGLLYLEEPGLGEPLPPLQSGWAAMSRETRPAVALRVGLSLALCLAEGNRPERARSVLGEAWRLYSRVSDEAEMLRVLWIEARALARVGEKQEAVAMLESIRGKLATEASLAEAALVSLDLALVLAETGRAAEIEPLAEMLELLFPDEPAVVLAVMGVVTFAKKAVGGKPRLREAAVDIASSLRRAFRRRGARIRPLPFA